MTWLVAVGGPVLVGQSDDVVATLVGRLDLEQYKQTIRGLTQFGDRRQGTTRNREAVDWIEAQLESAGCPTARLHYVYDPPPRERRSRRPDAPLNPTDRTPTGGRIGRNGSGPGGASIFGYRRRTGVERDPMAQPDERLRALNSEEPVNGPRQQVYCTKVGSTRPGEMYIIGAHMDGHGMGEAANDDGSGTALVIELARILSAPDVETDRSIRFALWNNEETGLNGSRAYVEQRQDLQGIEDPVGSGRYPEPVWLGMIQHDMMLFDHGAPRADGTVSRDQRPEADVNIEYQSMAALADEARDLAFFFKAANDAYATDYPASVGPHMTNTDSTPFMDHVPSISLRENERGMHIGAGWDPHWHQPTDVFSTFTDDDFRLGVERGPDDPRGHRPARRSPTRAVGTRDVPAGTDWANHGSGSLARSGPALTRRLVGASRGVWVRPDFPGGPRGLVSSRPVFPGLSTIVAVASAMLNEGAWAFTHRDVRWRTTRASAPRSETAGQSDPLTSPTRPPSARSLRVRATGYFVVGLLGVFPGMIFAEEGSRARWPDPVVPYYVNALNSDVSPDAARAAVEHGALTWSAQSDANVAFVYAGDTRGTTVEYNLRNEVFFRNDSEGEAIATTYTWRVADVILDTDIVFWDASYRFFTGSAGCVDGFYVEDIAAHEFGHAAGLAHSETPGATMFPRVPYCSADLRSLASDDRRVVEARYPERHGRPHPRVRGVIADVAVEQPASSVELAWTPTVAYDAGSPDDVHYVVERAREGAAFVAVAMVPGDQPAHVDRALEPDTTYSYRVHVRRRGTDGLASSRVSVRTRPGGSPPASPTWPSPVVGLSDVGVRPTLSWLPSLGATRYDLYLGTTSPPPLHEGDLTVTALTLPELPAGTTFYWRVVAHNASGGSPASPWSFTTVAVPDETPGPRGTTPKWVSK